MGGRAAVPILAGSLVLGRGLGNRMLPSCTPGLLISSAWAGGPAWGICEVPWVIPIADKIENHGVARGFVFWF